jgi:hypothetical protein
VHDWCCAASRVMERAERAERAVVGWPVVRIGSPQRRLWWARMVQGIECFEVPGLLRGARLLRDACFEVPGETFSWKKM